MSDQPIFERLHNHLGGVTDKHGETHVDCPFCGKPAKRGQTHFSYSSKGYKCHVCGEGGSLYKLASTLGLLDDAHAPKSLPRPTLQAPEPETPPAWIENIPNLIAQYEAAPDRFTLWKQYKPLLSDESVTAYHLGVGCLPDQKTRRLILPIWQGETLITTHLRGRLLPGETSDLPKWIAANGSKATVFITRDGLRSGHWVMAVEQPVDAILIHQLYPDIDAIAPTNGAGSWQGVADTLSAAQGLAGVIVAYDNDLAGNPNTRTRRQLQNERKAAGLPALKPHGPKLAKALRKQGIAVKSWRWDVDTPVKADIGWLLEQPGGVVYFKGAIQRLITPTHQEGIQADVTVNLRYVSDIDRGQLPASGGLVVRSPIGTGKTELITLLQSDMAARLGCQPKVLAVSPYEALSKNMAQRLDYESYKDHKAEFLRIAPQLGICLNSVYKLLSPKDGLPKYDLLVIDESEHVLGALAGGTFKPGEAVKAKETLEHLVKHAGLVVCLDAYASPVTVNWLKSIRSDVVTVVNEYTPPDKKPLTMYPTSEQAIAEADRLIDENNGPVLIASGSRENSKALALRYEAMLGQDAVMLVNQHTSGEKGVQQFLSSINTDLPKIRVLIYTSSMGTGVDITAPVRGVVGVFNNQPLDAEAILQMVGRARHAQEVHIYVRQAEGRQSTNPEALYNRKHDAALRSRRFVETFTRLDDAGKLVITENQKSLLWLISQIEARRNGSMNNLRANVERLARDCYAVSIVETPAAATDIKASIADSRALVAEAEKLATLKAAPIDSDTYEQIRESGQITPEVEAGHTRWLIEDTYQREITPPLYDAYEGGKGRGKLLRFVDIHKPLAEVVTHDKEQFEQGTELNRLDHRTAKYMLTWKLLKTAGFLDYKRGFLLDEISYEQIDAAVKDMAERFTDDLRLFWNWRADYSDDPVSVIRRVLGQLGLRLETIRSRQGNRYQIEQASLMTMLEYRTWRLAGIEQNNRTPDESVQKHGESIYYSSVNLHTDSISHLG